MARKLDDRLIHRIQTFSRDSIDDAERAEVVAEKAIEFARAENAPRWVAVREKNQNLKEWRWEMSRGTVARVWPLKSGSWVGQIESDKEEKRYSKIFRSSYSGMIALEGFRAWQNASVKDAEPS